MKKTSFLSVFALLGIISLVVWGCGGWFGRKDKEQTKQEQAKTSAADKPKLIRTQADLNAALLTIKNEQGVPIDSIIKSKKVLGTSMVEIEFKPEKCGLFPDLTYETIFNDPKYNVLFGMNQDYDVVAYNRMGSECGFSPYVDWGRCTYTLRYKKADIWQQTNAAIVEHENGCVTKVSAIYYNPLNEPEEAVITYEQALSMVLEHEYDSDKGKSWRREMMDSLGYIPDADFGFYPPKSYNAWLLAK